MSLRVLIRWLGGFLQTVLPVVRELSYSVHAVCAEVSVCEITSGVEDRNLDLAPRRGVGSERRDVLACEPKLVQPIKAALDLVWMSVVAWR